MPEPLDPTTQQPPVEPTEPSAPATPPDAPPKPDFATKEDLANLRGAIETLSIQFRNFGQGAAPTPPAPRGPTLSDQLSTLESKLESLDAQLEDAITSGKPGISKIQRERERILQTKIDLQSNAKLEEIRSMGVFAIDQLTDQVVSNQMPFLKIPEVKGAYDKAIRDLPPDQRMSPQIRIAAYQYAVGSNMDKVFDTKLQEHMRTSTAPPTQTPTATSGRTTDRTTHDPNRTPKPSEVWSEENLAALRAAGKTPDSYCRALGYRDFSEWWTKEGKEYYAEKET